MVEAVESALGQTYPRAEVIVVDDGSTDDTPRRLAAYASAVPAVADGVGRSASYHPPRIRLVRQDNLGTAAALNRGIQMAQGEWISWLSADDAFLPSKLEVQVAYAGLHPDVRVIHTDWYTVDAVGNVTGILRAPHFFEHQHFVQTLFQQCFINGSTTLIHRTCFQTHGLFAEDLPQAHDWDLWLRLARDYRFGHVPEPLVRYRWHGANLSAQRDALSYNEEVLRRAHAWYSV